MRATEIKFKKRRVDEKLSNWVGNYGAAALKQLGNRLKGDTEGEMSIVDKMGKEKFLNDFVGRAYAALNSEIQSGRVDPNLSSGTSTSPAEPPKTEPTAPAAPGAAAPAATPGVAKKAPGNAAAPGVGQKQTTQNINNYVQGLAKSLNAETDKNKKMAMAKELVNFMADRKDYPEWQNALATAQQVIKRGIADPNFSNAAINKLKAGQMMEAWQVYWINKLLESIGFTFKDLGFTLLKENKSNGKYMLAETKYYKLNNIFESILLNEAESISQFFKRWLPTYTGVQMTDTNTQNIIKKIEDTYKTDKGKAALTQLAQAAYAASMTPGYGGGGAPGGAGPGGGAGGGDGAGAAPGAAGAGSAAAPAKTGTSTDTIINTIQSQLAKLKGIDPALYADIIKKIGAGQSLQGLPGGSKPAAPAPAAPAPAAPAPAAPAPAAPAPAPVSESKRKIRK